MRRSTMSTVRTRTKINKEVLIEQVRDIEVEHGGHLRS